VWIDTFLVPEEVRVGEIQQIQAAEQLHPRELNQIDREEGCQKTEREAAQKPVPQRLLVSRAWKTKNHDGHDQCVVGTEQAFKGDEQTNGDEIGAGDIQGLCPS
jgi:hypothetical protein